MTVHTNDHTSGTIGSAIGAVARRVAGAFRKAAEIYVAGRELEARTLASLDERVLRDMGVNPYELRYWRQAEKTVAPVADSDNDELRRAA